MMNISGIELAKLRERALNIIAQQGKLYWCQAKVCGCIGCANHSMSKFEYDIAMGIPEVQKALQTHAHRKNGVLMSQWMVATRPAKEDYPDVQSLL